MWEWFLFGKKKHWIFEGTTVFSAFSFPHLSANHDTWWTVHPVKHLEWFTKHISCLPKILKLLETPGHHHWVNPGYLCIERCCSSSSSVVDSNQMTQAILKYLIGDVFHHSGQIIIFHQPRVPEIWWFPLQFTTIWGQTGRVRSRANLTSIIQQLNRLIAHEQINNPCGL